MILRESNPDSLQTYFTGVLYFPPTGKQGSPARASLKLRNKSLVGVREMMQAPVAYHKHQERTKSRLGTSGVPGSVRGSALSKLWVEIL